MIITKKTVQLTAALVGLALGGLSARAALSYWDVNGANAGAGTPGPLAGTWGIDPFWNASADGTGSTGPWTDGDTPVFSAGTDAVGEFTVVLGFYPTVAEMIFEEGQVTVGWTESAVITLTNAGGPISVASNAAPRMASVLGGNVGLTKMGSGTLYFVNTVAHTYTSDGGATTNTVITEGALSVGDGGATGGTLQDDATRGHHIINHGTLIFDRAGTITSFSGIISGSGDLVLKSGPTGLGCSLKLASLYTNTYTGDTLVIAGRLQAGGASGRCIPTGPGKGNVYLGTNGVLDVQGNDLQVNGLSGYGVVTNSFGYNGPADPGTDVPARTNILRVGDNDQSSTFSGVIRTGNNTRSNHVVLHKIGTGTLTLTRPSNYYAAPTVIHAGTLLANNTANSATGNSEVIAKPGATFGGSGGVNGRVTIEADATLSPGASIGTLTINNSLVLAGNVFIEVNKALVHSNDVTVVSDTITNAGTGTVTVTNLNPGLPFAPGDTFQIFNQPVTNGETLTIVSDGAVMWTNLLAVNGSIAVLPLGGDPSPAPATNLSIVALSPGTFILGGAGAANTAYDVYASTNVALPMSNWWLLGSTNSDAGGLIQFLDPLATNDQRFYRFSQP